MENNQKAGLFSHKMEGFFYIIWKYQVATENRYDFEREYGQAGSWAELFSTSDHYVDSILEMDLSKCPNHYILIDIWISKVDYDQFMAIQKNSYDALSKKLAFLYLKEELVAAFESAASLS